MKGKLIVISGPSGVGKGHVAAAMMEKEKNLTFSVSATTRAPRSGEIDGVHYSFVTRAEFEAMLARGEFLEYSEHNKNLYGTPRPQAEEKLKKGSVLLDIEPVGARQVKDNFPDAVLAFIMPPSVEELERRLRGRGDTPEEQVKLRMERAVWEMEQRFWYDYVVVNEDIDACAEEILRLAEC